MTEQAATLPITRSCPYAPPDEHRRLREESPVSRVTLPSGEIVWALTRHEDIRTMLTDPRCSSDRANPGFPRLVDRREPEAAPGLGRLMISMDPPEHGQARRAIVGEFTVKRMAALRPRIQEIVDEHIDAMLA